MKDQIYNMVQSGIPLESAYALLSLTDNQIKALEDDTDFQTKLRFYNASYERNLLDRMDHIMDINEEKGISTEIRWLLSRKFPERYGSKQVVVNQGAALPQALVGIYDAEPEDSSEEGGED